MFARRSRSSEAVLRLLMTIRGWPRAFKYIIFSEIPLVNLSCHESKRNWNWTYESFVYNVSRTSIAYPWVEGHFRELGDPLDQVELCAMDSLHILPLGWWQGSKWNPLGVSEVGRLLRTRANGGVSQHGQENQWDDHWKTGSNRKTLIFFWPGAELQMGWQLDFESPLVVFKCQVRPGSLSHCQHNLVYVWKTPR